jgi:SAM-dependent methyltransferase
MQENFYFDLYDKLYETGYHQDQNLCHTKRLFPHIDSLVEPRATILDVGCSNGYAVQYLTDHGYNAYGIDVSKIAVQYCLNRGLTTCSLQSITNTDFDNDFFDLVISSDTLEHLLPQDVSLATTELYRICKKYCLLDIACAAEGNKQPLQIIQYKYNQYHNLDGLHTCIMNPQEWDIEFNKAGFTKNKTISFETDDYNVIYQK